MEDTLTTLEDAIEKARSAALSADGEPPPEAHALSDLSQRMRS